MFEFYTKKKAIFTTRSDRNLEFLIDCWKKIKLESNDSDLYFNPPYDLKSEHTNIDITVSVIDTKFITISTSKENNISITVKKTLNKQNFII